jgi:hypothetical protein
MPYELVKKSEDIIRIIERYIKILKKEENAGSVIERFNTFDYWYYFDDISVFDGLNCIFIPNKFLGYQIHAIEPYNPTPRCGMDGARARKALNPFFEVIENEERYGVLYENLKKFAKKCNKEPQKSVIIFEPKDELRKLIEKDKI